MADHLLPSTEKLVAALKALPGYSAIEPGNPVLAMVTRAEANFYHDFFSPLTMTAPSLQLMMDLQAIGATELMARHRNGEFDATFEESELWANSPEGKAAMAQLVEPKPDRKGGAA